MKPSRREVIRALAWACVLVPIIWFWLIFIMSMEDLL